MNEIICPNCQSSGIEEHLATKDFFLTKDSFTIFRCLSCELLFTHPVPSAEVLYSRYYKSENYLSHNKKASGLFSRLYRVVQKINIRFKTRIIERVNTNGEKKILEVGAGTGDFLAACKRAGWSCTGIEPSAEARLVANEFHDILLLSSIGDVRETNFSVITLWHVLEHIPNLRETIRELKSMLAAEGRIIIAVPNYKSFDAQHYKQYWAGYDVPRHLYHFNTKSLSLLMSEAGFELTVTKPMFFDSFYASLLSEKYIRNNVIINYLKGIGMGLVSNISSLFTEEYSSVIYIFKRKAE